MAEAKYTRYILNNKPIDINIKSELGKQWLKDNPEAILDSGNQGDSNQSANVESQTSAQNPQQENTELKSGDGSSGSLNFNWLNYQQNDGSTSTKPFFDQSEEQAVAQLRAKYPGFKFEEVNDFKLGLNVVKVNSPDGKASKNIEFNIGQASEKQEVVESKYKTAYDDLTSFLNKYSTDQTNIIAAKAREERIRKYKTYNDKVSATEEEVANVEKKFSEPDLFKPVEEEVTRMNIQTGTPITTKKQILPYKEELEQAEKQLKDEGVEATREAVEDRARKILIDSDLAKVKKENTEALLDEAEDLGLESDQYELSLAAKEFTVEYNAKALELDMGMNEIDEGDLADDIMATAEKLENENYKYDIQEGEPFIKLESGKIVPASVMEKYNSDVKTFNEKINRVTELHKQLVKDSHYIEDVGDQMDLLRRNYNGWEEFATETTLGLFVELPAAVAYGGSRFLGQTDDYTNSAYIELKDKINNVRESYKKDVEFDDAFSSITNFGEFAAQELSNQIPIFAALAVPGGQALIGAQAFGDQYSDMVREERQINGRQSSQTKKWLTSLGFAATEVVFESLTTLPLIRNAKAAFLNSPAKNQMFKDGFKKYFKNNAARSLVYEPIGEAASEGLTTFSQNLISGKPLTEGLDHAMFSGLMFGTTLSTAPFAKGLYVSSFSDYNTKQGVRDRVKKMQRLQTINNKIKKGISLYGKTRIGTMEDVKANEAKIQELQEANESDYKRIEDKVKSLTPRAAKFFFNNSNRLEAIRLEAARVEDSNMPQDVKESRLADLKAEFDATQSSLDKFKNSDTFNNNWTLFQGDAKNKSEIKRINDLAKFNLSNEGNSDPSEDQVSEEARIIYNKEYIRNDIKKSKGKNKVVAHETVEETIEYLKGDTKAKIDNLSKQGLSDSELLREKQKLNDNLQENIANIKDGSNGFMNTDSKGENISVINIDNSAKNDRIETRTHEIKHAIFVNALSTDPKAFKGLSDQVLEWTKNNNTGAYERIINRAERRSDGSLLEDEVIAVFFEEVASGRVNLKTKRNSTFSGLLGFLASEGSKKTLDTDLDLAGETDAIKFLIGAAKKIKAGTLTLEEVKESTLIKDISSADNSKDAVKFSKENVKPEVDELGSMGWTKETWKSQGADLAIAEMQANKMLDGLIAAKMKGGLRDGSNDIKKDFISKVYSELTTHVKNFDPESNDSLFGWVNSQISNKAGNVYNREYKDKSLERAVDIDATTSEGAPLVQIEADTDILMEAIDEIGLDETEVEERSRLRRDIRLDDKMMQTVRNAVIKTFGTKLPNVDSKKFRTALEKAFRTELKKPLQDLMGGRSDYDLFLRNHAKAIIKAFPVETLVQMERNLKPEQRIFTESRRITKPTEVDKLISEGKLPKDTNRTSGPQLHTKKSFPGVEKVMAYFRGRDMETVLGYKVGASTLGTRKDKLAMELGVELAFDATAETIQNPEVAEKRQMILELQGIEQLENELAVIGKQIDRDPSIKFSKQGNIAKDFYSDVIDGGMTESSVRVAANKHYPDSNKSTLNKIVKQTLKKVGVVIERDEALQGRLKEISGKTKVEAILEIDAQDNLKKGVKNALRGLLEAEGNGKAIDPGTLANTVKGLNAQRNHLVNVVGSLVETEGLVKGVEVIIAHTQAMYAGAGKCGDGGLMPHKPGGQIIPTPNWSGDNGLKWKVYTQADVNAGRVPKGKKIGDFKLDSKGRKISRDNRQQATNGVEDFVALINQGLPKGTILTNPSKGKFVLTDTKTGVKTDLNTSLHGESSASLFSDMKRKGVKQTFKDRKQASLDARKVTKVILDLAWNKINKGEMTAGDFGLLVMSIGSSMNSPLRRSAYADRVPSNYKQLVAKYGPKAVGKLFQYEHGTPKEAVATKIIQSYIDKGEMSDKVWDKYTVQVIHKALDRIIDASGHKYTERIDGQPRAFNAQTIALAVDLSSKDFNELAPLESLDPSDTEVMGKNWLEVVDLLRNKVELSPNVLSRTGKGARTMKWSKDAGTKGMSTFDFDETLIIDGENFITATDPVTGKELRLSSGEWPIKGPGLAADGFTFDFSDFVNVRGGTDGPLLQKMKNQVKKYGNENVFVLTARMQDAAGPIHGWLKSKGVDIPFKNITGLGDGRGEAKAEWMLDKFAEGYNDMYFVDDAMPNVDAVKKVLDQLDIKSKVVQAKIKFSKDASKDFNDMLERSKGVASDEVVSAARAKIRGKQVRGTFFVPPSAEDFKGLIYSFLGKGKQGDQDLKWFKENLFDPFSKATREMDSVKQKMTEEYRAMKKAFPDTIKGLSKKIAGTDFTLDNAIRVYLWKEAGVEVPGLSDKEVNLLWSAVKADPKSEAFAQALSAMSRQSDGYLPPNAYWTAETIASDLANIVNKVNRADYLAEWIENKDLVFSSDNLNKIEAIYGTNFREALEDMLHAMETGSNRPTGKDKDVNRFLNWINGSVGAVMFFNTRSAVLQTLSTVNFLNFEDNNIFAAAKAFANQKQFWSDFSMLFNSDMLKQRRAGLKIDVSANELTEAFSKGKSKTEAVIAHLLQLGFTPTQLADSFAIAMGGSTFYRNRVKKYLKEGKSQKDAESQAFLDFQEIAEETQQSSRPDLISKQQRGVLGRIILAWANTPMQMTRLTKKALSDLVNRRGDDKANISRIIYYGVAQNIIFGTLQTGLAFLAFGSEEEEEKTDAKQLRMVNGVFDTLLRGTGVWGAAASTLKNVIMQLHEELGKGYGKKDWSRVSQKIFDLSPPLGTKHRKIMNAIKTYDYNKDVIKKMDHGINNPGWNVFTNVVEALTNAPIARVLNKAQNLKLALQANIETWQRVAIGLGWSAWSVGVEDQEIKEAKAEVKQDRKAESNKRAKEKKAEKKAKQDKENKAKGIKSVRCSGVKSDGTRCKITVQTKSKTAKCTYHKAFKDGSDTDGDGKKEYRCRAKTSSGKQCKNKTENKNKKCYAHQ